MSNIVEKDWITASGLRAVVLICLYNGRKSHRCGYVEVPKNSPLFGKSYKEPLSLISKARVDSAQIGKKSLSLAFTASAGAFEGETIRRSLDVVVDVHGGLTYSGGRKDYPVAGDGWWFGFDCAHAGDAYIESIPNFPNWPDSVVRELPYVKNECEVLAAFLQEIAL